MKGDERNVVAPAAKLEGSDSDEGLERAEMVDGRNGAGPVAEDENVVVERGAMGDERSGSIPVVEPDGGS